MPPAKQKNTINLIDQLEGILKRDQYKLSDNTDDQLYSEQPVDIVTFVTSKDWLGMAPQMHINGEKGEDGEVITAPSPLSPEQLEFIEKATDFENEVTNLVLWVGKGGGKNFCATVSFCYAAYKLLCMRNPHAYFGRDPIKPITLMNVGGNADQGKANFFNPLIQMIKRDGFLKWLVSKGFDPKVHITTNLVILPKQIQMYSGHTSTAGIEGYDVLFGLVDEIDDGEFKSAANIYRTLNTSASTRFGRRRKVMTISFRRYQGSSGVLKQMYYEYKAIEARDGTAYARRYSTWEFNNRPGLYEALLPSLIGKPEESACMLESKDDEGYYDSWIKDADRIKNSMKSTRSWIFDMPVPKDDWLTLGDAEYVWEKDGEIQRLDPYDIPIRQRGNPKIKYVLACDPGLGNVIANGDAFGITLAHRDTVYKAGKKIARPVIDFSFRFTGRMFPEGEVQMLAIEKLIDKLNKMGYNISIYSFDGWQSAHFSQNLKRNYPAATVLGHNLVENRDYAALRDAIFSEMPPSKGTGDLDEGGGIDWYWHPIVYWELKELRVDRKKGKVDHQEHTSKDISDTIAKVVRIITLQWPWAEDGLVVASGSRQSEKQIAEKKREEIQKTQDKSQLYSDVAGLGRFRR
jgi:hypothetical protein